MIALARPKLYRMEHVKLLHVTTTSMPYYNVGFALKVRERIPATVGPGYDLILPTPIDLSTAS